MTEPRELYSYDPIPTKKEILEFARRTKIAARAIENLVRNEKRLRATASFNDGALRDWAEEISGCGSEVQNLLERRYSLR